MKNTLLLFVFLPLLVAAGKVDYRKYSFEKQVKKSENIVWNVTYCYNARDISSPRVLLVGDSICNGYQKLVRSKLGEKVNMTFWATSYCITDPAYLRMFDVILDSGRFDLIIFNNGLHSLSTDRKAWKKAYSMALDYLAVKVPETRIVLLNSTPKKDDDKRVDEINKLTSEIAKERNLPLVDINSFCSKWSKKMWRDNYHFVGKGKAQQAQFITEAVLKYIGKTSKGIVQQSSETGPDGKLK